MSSTSVAPFIPTAQEALRAFLSTLTNKEAPLKIGAPAEATFGEAGTQAETYLTVVASGPDLQYAVMLSDGWLARLSQAMVGEPLAVTDEGAEDLIFELAGQGHASVDNALSATGMRLSEVTFSVNPPGSPLAPGTLPDTLLKIPFDLNMDDQALSGFIMIPNTEHKDAPETATPQPEPVQEKTESAPAVKPDGQSVDVSPLAFRDLGAEVMRGDGGNANFNLLADVELEITVELGRRKLPLAELLRLTTGSVVELEKLVGEPLEVYANGRFIGEGEAVVIDEQFGIRITTLASSKQRAKAFL